MEKNDLHTFWKLCAFVILFPPPQASRGQEEAWVHVVLRPCGVQATSLLPLTPRFIAQSGVCGPASSRGMECSPTVCLGELLLFTLRLC